MEITNNTYEQPGATDPAAVIACVPDELIV